jgi:hypothetical protein
MPNNIEKYKGANLVNIEFADVFTALSYIEAS